MDSQTPKKLPKEMVPQSVLFFRATLGELGQTFRATPVRTTSSYTEVVLIDSRFSAQESKQPCHYGKVEEFEVIFWVAKRPAYLTIKGAYLHFHSPFSESSMQLLEDSANCLQRSSLSTTTDWRLIRLESVLRTRVVSMGGI